ncbi:MAG: helix-turn-helix domain-containing protein [Candidatus Sericytochromatia bacterium]
MGLKWKLRHLMRERRISNKRLAESIGVHRNTVLLLKEDAPTMIRLKHLEALCEVLNCQPSDLFEFTQENRSGVTGNT